MSVLRLSRFSNPRHEPAASLWATAARTRRAARTPASKDPMDLKEMLLQEFDQEMAATRSILERVPMDRPDWIPHEKSMPLGGLATHVATLPMLTIRMMRADELDFNSVDPAEYAVAAGSREALLARMDDIWGQARAALAGADAPDMAAEWTMRAGDQVFFRMPRWLVHRRMTMNHIVHHRAQLGVYLRLLGVPLPGIYGPSADEMGG